MVERTVVVQNQTGLHARPAAEFVRAAGRFACRLSLRKQGREVNAKSILEVLSLGVTSGTEIVIRAEGTDEEQAVAHLVTLVESRFGEA